MPVRRLADDCFAHGGGSRLPVREALALLEARTAPIVAAERVPLAEAAGRILAEALVSPRDVPAFDNAAVDGYAFAHAPAMREQATRFRLAPGRAAAGHPLADAVPAGSAVRVLTGAAMPAGVDTVALQEEVEADEAEVLMPAGLKAGANRRLAGEDVRAGQVVLQPGQRLGAHHLGLVAELGIDPVPVHAPLRVAILSTGDELVPPGRAELPAGGVFDANRFILRGLLRSLPVEVADLGILPDDPAVIAATLAEAAERNDVILTSGGASRGDEDHVVRSIEAMGQLDFWQIAMKPGRPLAFGRLGGAVFVGLPGNPVATMVCFLLLARPVLLRLAGAAWAAPRAVPVPAGFAFRKKPGRSEYLRGRLEPAADGTGLAVRRIEREGSGILTSMVEAHGLIEVAAEVERIEPGQPVPFLSFPELGIPA